MSAYNKSLYLKSLRESYKEENRPGFSTALSPQMKIFKSNLIKANNIKRKADDYTQNKYYFKQKIKDIARVPVTYYFGDDLKAIREVLLSLDEFVIKPNHLSLGIGIRVLNRHGEKFTDINGDILTIDDILDECKVLLELKRLNTDRKIFLEERIKSHPAFNTYDGCMVDLRMYYYRNMFLWCTARMPTSDSRGYSNRSRGASVSYVSNDGNFVNDQDERFQKGEIRTGKLPFFEKLVLTGQKVTELYGIVFQTVDMTMNEKEEVVVIESEQLPKIEDTFTPYGVEWLNSIIAKDLNVGELKYRMLHSIRRISNYINRLIYKYPKDY